MTTAAAQPLSIGIWEAIRLALDATNDGQTYQIIRWLRDNQKKTIADNQLTIEDYGLSTMAGLERKRYFPPLRKNQPDMDQVCMDFGIDRALRLPPRITLPDGKIDGIFHHPWFRRATTRQLREYIAYCRRKTKEDLATIDAVTAFVQAAEKIVPGRDDIPIETLWRLQRRRNRRKR